MNGLLNYYIKIIVRAIIITCTIYGWVAIELSFEIESPDLVRVGIPALMGWFVSSWVLRKMKVIK